MYNEFVIFTEKSHILRKNLQYFEKKLQYFKKEVIFIAKVVIVGEKSNTILRKKFLLIFCNINRKKL